jgi:serine/threonine-protein kinase
MVSDAPSRVQLPAKIGRYPVLGYLADGGMAEIFLGRDAGRPVVIKRILPHLARQQSFVSMFIDEARIGSLVHHPNVVETRELGQVGNDLFLVMEYLAGENVSGILRRTTSMHRLLPFALGAYVIAEACAGLHAAHELADEDGKLFGLVHRDISPSNLIVTYDGDVKVLDFGVATAAHRLTRTATGQVKGKFSYMSPEQCLGEQLDRRTDIFALGVVLYELTTGHRLFKRTNELLVLRAVTEEAVPLPSRKIPNYPANLERVVMRALSRERDRRQSTALELRDELIAALALDGGYRAALAETMAELFPERIAEKRALVRHVRAGTEMPIIPAAEVDENVEMPQVEPRGTQSRATSMTSRGRNWFVIVMTVLIVGGGGAVAAWWYLQQQDAESQQPAAAQPPPVAAIVPDAALVLETVDASTALTVRVESIPSGATVIVDGEERGKTPFDLELPAPQKIALELQLAGHTSVRQDLELDRAQRLLIPLSAVPVEPNKKPAKKKPPKPDPFKRFD